MDLGQKLSDILDRSHLLIALLLFFALLALWIKMPEDKIWSLVEVTFGAIMGFLTGRVSKPSEPPTP